MSLTFNDTSTHRGIIQGIERKIYGMDGVGRISGNSTLLAQWTAEVNLALDRAFFLIFNAAGRWQFDDANHTTNPTLTTNLVANQRVYDFTEDSAGNLLLEIHAVYVKNNGIFSPLTPVDELTEVGFYDGQDATGLPLSYGKKGDSLYLDPVPSANVTGGLKVEVNREASYFTSGDTSKKPGFAGHLHEYLVFKPSFEYAAVNNLANATALQSAVLTMEEAIKMHYSKRSRDEQDVLQGEQIMYE